MDVDEAASGAGVRTATVANARDARAFVAVVLTPAVAASTVETVRLIVSELVSNALQHGGADAVEVALSPAADAVELMVRGGRDATGEVAHPSQWSIAEPAAATGRGLGIVAALADDIRLATHDGRLVVACRVRC